MVDYLNIKIIFLLVNNIDLIKLDINYNIQWEECSCLKGIRLEDVTEELEDKAYEEMRHN